MNKDIKYEENIKPTVFVTVLGESMNPSVLRKIWAAIEAAPLINLLGLNDADLVQVLVTQVISQNRLSNEETECISTYLYSKTTLIRDLA